MKRWLSTTWTTLRNDVLDNPTIGQGAAAFITFLVVLVVILSAEYAPLAVEGGYHASSEGVIPIEWGYRTVFLVAAFTLFISFESRIEHWLSRFSGRLPPRLGDRANRLMRGVQGAVWLVLRPLSVLMSALDILLARFFSIVLAGSGWRATQLRYAHFLLVVALAAALGLNLPAPYGLVAACAGAVAILAIARRWTWVEADRSTFIVERGRRRDAIRVGFNQDLRDQALLGLVLLLGLTPIILLQIHLATCSGAAAGCAFEFAGEGEIPQAPLQQWWLWLGYFGAELAKSVPFVDWSEVFNVSNASPLQPRTAFGAQTVFVLRATLDLLLIAAILQALLIAGRLRDQDKAFRAGRLPILDPFAERREMLRAYENFVENAAVAPTDQPVVQEFPQYEQARLRELVLAADDHRIARIAAALLEHQYSGRETDVFWTEFSQRATEDGLALKSWVEQVAARLSPSDTHDDAPTRRTDLRRVALDRSIVAPSRALALRSLGEMGPAETDQAFLLRLLADAETPDIRADAAVALAKTRFTDMREEIARAAKTFEDGFSETLESAHSAPPFRTLRPLLSTAYAAAWAFDVDDEVSMREALSAFPQAVQDCVFAPEGGEHIRLVSLLERVMRIQRTPTAFSPGAPPSPRGFALDRTLELRPGSGPFPETFVMGSPESDDLAYPSERPQRAVRIDTAFALGVTAVTRAEYRAFLLSLGRAAESYLDNPLRPATELRWQEARGYCSWLTAITGDRYRLPSEAEWEYACRAGSATRFEWGDVFDPTRLNSNEGGPGHTVDVGSYAPNSWGLYDMHGNVYEWCSDPWHSNYAGAPETAQVWLESGDFANRVLRGGSWYFDGASQRSALRRRMTRADRDNDDGFRIVRTLPRLKTAGV